VKLYVYKTFEEASRTYNEFKKLLNYSSCNDDENGPTVVETITITHPDDPTRVRKQVSEEGYWKRQTGYELFSVNIGDPNCSFEIKAWPNTRTYS